MVTVDAALPLNFCLRTYNTGLLRRLEQKWLYQQIILKSVALTLLLIKSDLWSTMPHVAIPIKCSWDALSFNSGAPRDMTVWPFTASPTWRITPVFVPPVMIQAPVVWAACGTWWAVRSSHSCVLLSLESILIPRAHDPFGLHQGSSADQKDRGLWGRECSESFHWRLIVWFSLRSPTDYIERLEALNASPTASTQRWARTIGHFGVGCGRGREV